MTVFSTLVIFIVLSLLVALLAALMVVVPWLRSSKEVSEPVDNRLIDLNIDVYKSRLRELAADEEAGTVDDVQYITQKTELERQLLDAEQTAMPMKLPSLKGQLALIVSVPVLAICAYVLFSDRSDVFDLWRAQDKVGDVSEELLSGKIDVLPEWAFEDGAGLFTTIQTNVHRNADDSYRWMVLSEIFLSFEEPESALEALSRAYWLSPDDKNIAAEYAQLNFLANGGSLDIETRRVLEDILKGDPENEAAQMLMARGEAKAGNYEQAQGWIAKMRQRMEQNPSDDMHALTGLDELTANIIRQQAQAAEGVDVSVTVNAKLLPLITADDVLFVAIRAAAGGPPYAAKRIPISNLKQGNISLSLSNLDAMMADRTLQPARASGEQLVVTARISHSGNAISASGDLSSNPVLLKSDQQQVNIEINQQVP
ncbi:c-type cytochrome biogenesis protein CcmI [Psychrobacter sp. Ps7]|jgi:cytochrome c-type biogenesis protein CcmI|uniref:c-type cytochrome biogenesis protein CcmI n=1 Tax=Psychrobacter sp. Ps7 TaxID=2790961 RepID=UPI001EDF5EE8|nr:c-type cytochrome biogenesis protein CcmI [Psychrobacter sp. Ps7]MCG3872063.1 c-type cytochrome biogenesis protein CcmI [Psychrobacter sp. Ps7]